jgi:hypothetical protein
MFGLCFITRPKALLVSELARDVVVTTPKRIWSFLRMKFLSEVP